MRYLRSMRLYAATAATLLALSAWAQFAESVEVRVLEIEATVLDRSGQRVEGLTRNDFAVTLDGKPAEVTNFFVVQRGVIRDPSATDAAAEPELAPEPATVPTRLVVIVDDVHLHQGPKRRGLQAIQRHLEKTMDAATTASILQWNGSVMVRVKPTTHRQLLLRTLETMEKEPAGAMQNDGDRRTVLRMKGVLDPDAYFQVLLSFCESQRREGQRSIDGLREILRSMQGMEGRKHVLYLSEGIPLFAGYEMIADAVGNKGIPLDAMRYDQSRALRDLAKAAQDAGVVFSTLDPSPTVAPMDETLDYKLMRDNARDSVTLLARQTGGQVIFDRNDFDRELALLDDQVSTYYSLGVSPPAAAKKDVKVEVKVKGQPQLRVLTATRRSLPSRDEAIANAVRAHLYLREEANPLDARVTVTGVERKGDRCVASIAVQVPAQRLDVLPTQIDIRFAVLDDADQESDVKTVTKDVPNAADVREALTLGLRKRKYVVSLGVVDRGAAIVSYLQRDVDCR